MLLKVITVLCVFLTFSSFSSGDKNDGEVRPNPTEFDLLLIHDQTLSFYDNNNNYEAYANNEFKGEPILVIDKNGVWVKSKQICKWNFIKEHKNILSHYALDCQKGHPFIEYININGRTKYGLEYLDVEEIKKRGVVIIKVFGDKYYLKSPDFYVSRSRKKIERHHSALNKKFLEKTNYTPWTKEIIRCLQSEDTTCFAHYLSDHFRFSNSHNLCETDAAEWADSREQSRAKFMKCLSNKKFKEFLIKIFSSLTYPEFEGRESFDYATHNAIKDNSNFPFEYGINLDTQRMKNGKWVIEKFKSPGD